MPDYKYNAIDRNGAQTSGKIDAASEEQARQKLMARGLMVTTLASDGGAAKSVVASSSAPKKSRFSFGAKVSDEEVTIMTRQLATLIVAGLPLLRVLHAAGKLDALQDLWCQPTRAAYELYDLRRDPAGLSNVATAPAHAATVATLSAQLQAAVKTTFPPSGKVPELIEGTWAPIVVAP